MHSNETVEIFRTNVANKHDARLLVRKLSAYYPAARFNVDLHDADRVLRMQGPSELKENVMTLTKRLGFECSELS